jgi:cytochrome c-type biogenesis protein CcmH/NrfG
LAIHTTASARVAASAWRSAASASARVCGGCGNAGAAAAVSTAASSKIRHPEGTNMRAFLLFFILSLSAYAADDPPSPPEKKKDAVIERYEAAAARQDWPAAAASLKEGLAKDPGNARYHNLFAYSLRKGPDPDLGLVFKHYNEALRIDPGHRGAHEYIGEAYLLVGNVAKAKEHLGVLDKLCFLPCAEYTGLKKAIAAHEKK